MHSSSSGQRGKYTAPNCNCSSSSCGKHLDHYLRQSTAQFPSHPPPHPPPSLSLPLTPTAIPYEMASHNSCLPQPPFHSIRTSATSSFNSPTRAVVYVYELPYNVRKAICDLLDADNSWRELGGRYMGFNDTQLTLLSHALYRSASPTNELLTKWESSNAKVAHLYRFLAAMKHRRAMNHLLGYVDEKLRLMYEDFDKEVTVHFDSAEMRGLHEGPRSGMPLDIPNTSFKATSFKHPFVNSQQRPDSRQFFPENLNFKGKSNSQSEEDTLVDRNNEKKSNDNESTNGRTSKKKLDYLVKVEDFEIPYKELSIATDDFSKDNILGSGGFGTVYVGEWKGTKVAVKRLKGLDNSAQAFTELRVLNCCRIDNILPLYGVALDGPEPCLVYQYMPNGSLEDRLLCKHNTSPLTWIQRANIGEGVARALNFLHTLKGNPYVHGDVKSANILLSSTFEPKLGDFGLARKVEKRGRNEDSLYTHCTVSSVNGTSVYLPAEYLRNKILSPAVDVYSYGIVVLEMATGRRAYDGKRLLINSIEDECSRALLDSRSRSTAAGEAAGAPSKTAIHEGLMDKRIRHLTEEKHWFYCLLELGRKCAHKIKSKRPIMIQILEYFNQCKTTDRIHKLCDKRSSLTSNEQHQPRPNSRVSLSKSNIKSPLELQLWYDFVRKSCGTLSDAVFENFGAQVTKLIEDCRFSLSNESNLHLDRLLNSLHGGSNSSVNESVKEESRKQSSPVQVAATKAVATTPPSNNASPSVLHSIVSNDSSDYQNESLNFPQMLQFMTLSSNNSDVNSECTIEDELSSQENSATDLTATTNGTNGDESKNANDTEVPFIPLLTALGFQNDDISEIINSSSGINLSAAHIEQENES